MSWRFKGRPGRLLSVVLALIGLAAAAAGDVPTVPPLTLADCIREALSNNPGLGADEARATAAHQAARAAQSARLPRLDIASDYSYSDRPQRLAQPSYQGEILRYDNDIAQAYAEARVPIFAGGRLVARQRAAELAAAAVQFDLLGSRQDLLLNVAATYLAAIQQKNVIEAIDGSLKALGERLQVAGAMRDVGRTAPLDLLKVEVRVAAVEQKRSKARRDLDLISSHLAVLLGRDPSASLPLVSAFPVLPPLAAGATDEVLQEAAARRPELSALDRDIARRQAELTQAKAESWPSLETFVRWTSRAAIFPEDGPTPTRQQYSLGAITLKMPLWTSGELAARRRQAEAQLREAQERQRASLLQVTDQVRRESAAQAEAVERERVAAKAAGQAQDAFGIEKANYDLGRATVNDILDAQAALLDADLALAQVRHDIALTSISLVWAIGRNLEKWLIIEK